MPNPGEILPEIAPIQPETLDDGQADSLFKDLNNIIERDLSLKEIETMVGV